MAGSQGNHIKQLSNHTATAMYHTCIVLLGQFRTDPLEKEFSKLHQGSGGTNFINVQQCLEKLHIK